MIPSSAFPPEVRRAIYTTNVIESRHMPLRKIIETRGHCPCDEAATTLPWLALRNVMSKSVRSTREWKIASHPVRRALHQRPTVIRASHTEFLTGPRSNAGMS